MAKNTKEKTQIKIKIDKKNAFVDKKKAAKNGPAISAKTKLSKDVKAVDKKSKSIPKNKVELVVAVIPKSKKYLPKRANILANATISIQSLPKKAPTAILPTLPKKAATKKIEKVTKISKEKTTTKNASTKNKELFPKVSTKKIIVEKPIKIKETKIKETKIKPIKIKEKKVSDDIIKKNKPQDSIKKKSVIVLKEPKVSIAKKTEIKKIAREEYSKETIIKKGKTNARMKVVELPQKIAKKTENKQEKIGKTKKNKIGKIDNADVSQISNPSKTKKAKVITVRYSDEDLEEFRDVIVSQKTEFLEEYRMLKERVEDFNNYDLADENMTYSVHMAEQGSEAMEKEKVYARILFLTEHLKKLNDALGRIEDKSFGICKVCHCLIAKERLLMVPVTTLSASWKNHGKCPDNGIDKIEKLK